LRLCGCQTLADDVILYTRGKSDKTLVWTWLQTSTKNHQVKSPEFFSKVHIYFVYRFAYITPTGQSKIVCSPKNDYTSQFSLGEDVERSLHRANDV